jgi:hypothetical protein
MLKSSLNYAQIQRKAALTMPFGRIQVQRMRTSGVGLVHSEGQEDTFHYFGSKRKMQK